MRNKPFYDLTRQDLYVEGYEHLSISRKEEIDAMDEEKFNAHYKTLKRIVETLPEGSPLHLERQADLKYMGEVYINKTWIKPVDPDQKPDVIPATESAMIKTGDWVSFSDLQGYYKVGKLNKVTFRLEDETITTRHQQRGKINIPKGSRIDLRDRSTYGVFWIIGNLPAGIQPRAFHYKAVEDRSINEQVRSTPSVDNKYKFDEKYAKQVEKAFEEEHGETAISCYYTAYGEDEAIAKYVEHLTPKEHDESVQKEIVENTQELDGIEIVFEDDSDDSFHDIEGKVLTKLNSWKVTVDFNKCFSGYGDCVAGNSPAECHLFHCNANCTEYRGEAESCTHRCDWCGEFLKADHSIAGKWMTEYLPEYHPNMGVHSKCWDEMSERADQLRDKQTNPEWITKACDSCGDELTCYQCKEGGKHTSTNAKAGEPGRYTIPTHKFWCKKSTCLVGEIQVILMEDCGHENCDHDYIKDGEVIVRTRTEKYEAPEHARGIDKWFDYDDHGSNTDLMQFEEMF